MAGRGARGILIHAGYVGMRLVAAAGFLFQFGQKFGGDPFLRGLRFMDDCPGLVVLAGVCVEGD